MRTATLILTLILVLLPAAARPDQSDADRSAREEYNEAQWAEWDAQARITDGDYDSAVQAEQRAQAARRAADDQASRTPNAPATDRR